MDLAHGYAKSPGHALAVGWIGLIAIAYMADLDHFGSISHGTSGVLKQGLLLLRLHQAKELAGLGVVIVVVFPEIPVICLSFQL